MTALGWRFPFHQNGKSLHQACFCCIFPASTVCLVNGFNGKSCEMMTSLSHAFRPMSVKPARSFTMHLRHVGSCQLLCTGADTMLHMLPAVLLSRSQRLTVRASSANGFSLSPLCSCVFSSVCDIWYPSLCVCCVSVFCPSLRLVSHHYSDFHTHRSSCGNSVSWGNRLQGPMNQPLSLGYRP